jgi:hypothetical protein
MRTACEPTIAHMVRLDFVIIFIAVALFIYALVDTISIYETRIKSLNKISWVFIVILIPILGPILWLTLGKARRNDPDSVPRGQRGRTTLAPDDDPVFLRNATRMEEQDERIRRLEAELKALNDDKPDE